MLQPLDHVGALRAAATGHVEWCPCGVVGHPVEVGTKAEQPLGRASLAPGAGMPETLERCSRAWRWDSSASKLLQYAPADREPRLPKAPSTVAPRATSRRATFQQP